MLLMLLPTWHCSSLFCKYKKKNDKNLKQEEIEALISKETIKINDLEKMAKDRIININNYLVKEKGINPKQVVLTNKLNYFSSKSTTTWMGIFKTSNFWVFFQVLFNCKCQLSSSNSMIN